MRTVRKVGTLQPEGLHGRCIRVSGGGDAVGDGVEPLPVLVFQAEVQVLQPGGVVRRPLHVHTDVGGIDLHLLHHQGLAVQPEGAVHRDDLPLGGVGGVKSQIEVEGSQNVWHTLRAFLQHGVLRRLFGMGRRGIWKFFLSRLSGDAEGHGESIRNVAVMVVQGEVQQRTRFLLEIRTQHSTVLPGGEFRHLGGEALVPLTFQGEEDVHLFLVHDHVLDGGGDAVFRLGLPDGLDIVVLHGGGERW